MHARCKALRRIVLCLNARNRQEGATVRTPGRTRIEGDAHSSLQSVLAGAERESSCRPHCLPGALCSCFSFQRATWCNGCSRSWGCMPTHLIQRGACSKSLQQDQLRIVICAAATSNRPPAWALPGCHRHRTRQTRRPPAACRRKETDTGHNLALVATCPVATSLPFSHRA